MIEYRLINGVDIVDIRRIEKILSERQDSLLNKLFTDREKDYLKSKNYRSESIAGMFAGKEAISKAIGTGIGKLGWKDLEILHKDSGQPIVNLSPDIKNKYNIISMEISISHEKNYALAFVVGERKIRSDE